MALAFDGSKVPDKLPKMACGGTPYFDVCSGYSYVCDTCMATIGSIGQSSECKAINLEAEQRQQVIDIMGFKEN